METYFCPFTNFQDQFLDIIPLRGKVLVQRSILPHQEEEMSRYPCFLMQTSQFIETIEWVRLSPFQDALTLFDALEIQVLQVMETASGAPPPIAAFVGIGHIHIDGAQLGVGSREHWNERKPHGQCTVEFVSPYVHQGPVQQIGTPHETLPALEAPMTVPPLVDIFLISAYQVEAGGEEVMLDQVGLRLKDMPIPVALKVLGSYPLLEKKAMWSDEGLVLDVFVRIIETLIGCEEHVLIIRQPMRLT